MCLLLLAFNQSSNETVNPRIAYPQLLPCDKVCIMFCVEIADIQKGAFKKYLSDTILSKSELLMLAIKHCQNEFHDQTISTIFFPFSLANLSKRALKGKVTWDILQVYWTCLIWGILSESLQLFHQSTRRKCRTWHIVTTWAWHWLNQVFQPSGFITFKSILFSSLVCYGIDMFKAPCHSFFFFCFVCVQFHSWQQFYHISINTMEASHWLVI